MRVMRAEPGRFADMTTRSVGAVWRAYDLQLTTYAALLGAVGLVMAYTNSVEAGQAVLANGTRLLAGADVVGPRDRRLPRRRPRSTTGGSRRSPGRSTCVNVGLLVLTLAIGDGVGGSARWVTLGPLTFQFSELAKILMIDRPGDLPRATARAAWTRWSSILGACLLMAPPWLLVMMQPDLGTSLVLVAILAGMLFMSGRQPALAARDGRRACSPPIPLAWTYVLRDYQKNRILSFLNPAADTQGSGLQVDPGADRRRLRRVRSGPGSPTAPSRAASFLPVQESDFVFAVLAQELGFIGALVVFLLFAALLWRDPRRARGARATRSGRCSGRASPR